MRITKERNGRWLFHIRISGMVGQAPSCSLVIMGYKHSRRQAIKAAMAALHVIFRD